MDEFPLKWRFNNDRYNILPTKDLDQLIPLNREASKFLENFIAESGLHDHEPFGNGFFKTIDSIDINITNKEHIQKWLSDLELPTSKSVFLSWEPDISLVTKWGLVLQYFNDFFYSSSDDLTIIDESLNWAVLFHHSNVIYFGSN